MTRDDLLGIGDQQDRRLPKPVDGPDLRAEAKTIAGGKAQAHDEEIEVAAFGLPERIRRVGGDLQLESAFQPLPDAPGRILAIVHDEDTSADIGVLGVKIDRAPPDGLHRGRPQRQFVRHHLEPDEALHPGDKSDLADRLRQKIVSAAFEAPDAVLGLIQRRYHDDRHMRRPRIRLERRTHIEAAHVRHHDIEQDEVDTFPEGSIERFAAVRRRAHVKILSLQTRLEQPHIGGDIVDNEDTRGHGGKPTPRR